MKILISILILGMILFVTSSVQANEAATTFVESYIQRNIEEADTFNVEDEESGYVLRYAFLGFGNPSRSGQAVIISARMQEIITKQEVWLDFYVREVAGELHVVDLKYKMNPLVKGMVKDLIEEQKSSHRQMENESIYDVGGYR